MERMLRLAVDQPRFAASPAQRGTVMRFLLGDAPLKSGLTREQCRWVEGETGLAVAAAISGIVDVSGILSEVGQPLYSLEYQKMLTAASAGCDLRLPREVFLRQDVMLTVSRRAAAPSSDGMQGEAPGVEVVLWRLYAQGGYVGDESAAESPPVSGKRLRDRKECI
jgi:hypothetical protein